ncbi:15962_t:CDS:2 [Dentiscutata heterogama]|uniref:15962_t:CDS:1 n=1 Tax=Dentiscutata heterogama TaxID=1316150 RepID=A0ACA9KDB4_9GLOM|nr:15962_t:CDS:2 [Dentiscutata heterogama]
MPNSKKKEFCNTLVPIFTSACTYIPNTFPKDLDTSSEDKRAI